jgi:hypothetical protein
LRNGYVNGILTFEGYLTGFTEINWGGDPYKIPVPVIVDTDIAERVKERRARYKAYPAGNLKTEALAAGVVYCAKCGTKMAVVGISDKKRNKKTYVYYACINCTVCRNRIEGCAKRVALHKIDAEVWRKLWELISVPGKLEAAIEKRVTQLQAEEFDATAECAKLTVKLDELAMMRQEAIALHQQRIITKDDLALRLTSLSIEQVAAEHELRDKSLLVGNRAERLLAVARAYREAVVGGAVDVDKEPELEEEAARLFQFKRTMVEGLVRRVNVKADKTTEVTFELDFSTVLPAESLCIENTAA